MVAISGLNAQLFTTDVIIQGSLCVGTDCVSGETFGFTTIKLKENNLRIKFEDTSAGDFPSNDWSIGANETTNNGKNLFFIDDDNTGRRVFAIEAAAPTGALYVDNIGRVGLKTIAPETEIHIKDGDTPTLRLEQDNSAGFAAQSWDVAGNEANFFVRDNNTGVLPFKIKPGAPDNALVVDPTGSVVIGGTEPNGKLYVNGSLVVNGDITALSDQRIKTNITNLHYGLPSVMQMSAKEYEFVQDGDYLLNLATGRQLGLIAQELEHIIPELVHNDFQVKDQHGEISYLKKINYIEIIPVLIRAIQDQQALIEKKDTEITEIKSQLASLSQRIDQLAFRPGTDLNIPLTSPGPGRDADAMQDYKAPVTPASPSTPKSNLNNGRGN
jgi:hypothetical protein